VLREERVQASADERGKERFFAVLEKKFRFFPRSSASYSKVSGG